MFTQIRQDRGFSLVELLISITISMVIMLGVISMLSNASRSHMELNKSSQLIENGRFAIQQLHEDLRHAGYYGYYYYNDLDTPASLPDPCETDDAALLLEALALQVQGYSADSLTLRPDLAGVGCESTLLVDANLQPGSDIVLLRRANTTALSAAPETNEVYLQSNVTTAEIQFGDPAAVIPGESADAAAVTIFNKDGTTPADIRKYNVHLYFIAPCSSGSGSNGICAVGDDDIPTLKRLELQAVSGITSMVITPLAEGVEYMKVSYGVDDSPATVDSTTGLVGDGVPDFYTQTPTSSQWQSVVTVRINMLVRTVQTTQGHSDDKSYTLGTIDIPAKDDGYKRHVFSSEIRLSNIAGPREVP